MPDAAQALRGPQLPLAMSSFLSKVAGCAIASGKVGMCVRELRVRGILSSQCDLSKQTNKQTLSR